MSYEIVWLPKGAVKRFYGQLTGQDIYRSVIEVEQDIRFDELRYVINDFLDVTNVLIGDLDIREIAAIDRAASMTNPHIHIAILTADPGIAELARQYAESEFNVYPTQIFGSRAEADAWLAKR